jgi:hypothetical protein
LPRLRELGSSIGFDAVTEQKSTHSSSTVNETNSGRDQHWSRPSCPRWGA